MSLLADEPTITQAPVTHLLAAAKPQRPARENRVRRVALDTAAILFALGLAAWALTSWKVALLLLRMHG